MDIGIKEAYSIFVLIIAGASLIFLAWSTFCNNKTSKHRQQLVNWVFAHNNYKELISYYKEVSYEQHLWAMIKFQNPFKLYDSELFSSFHMLRHGPCEVNTSDGRKIICPYTPKSV